MLQSMMSNMPFVIYNFKDLGWVLRVLKKANLKNLKNCR